jgi:hypothetical protein
MDQGVERGRCNEEEEELKEADSQPAAFAASVQD